MKWLLVLPLFAIIWCSMLLLLLLWLRRLHHCFLLELGELSCPIATVGSVLVAGAVLVAVGAAAGADAVLLAAVCLLLLRELMHHC
jgi:hypothetical protein